MGCVGGGLENKEVMDVRWKGMAFDRRGGIVWKRRKGSNVRELERS